jgi:SAM-dependent methyltransferase
MTWEVDAGLDLKELLSRALVAHVATSGQANTRPVWFLWEDDAIWWLTDTTSQLYEALQLDPQVAFSLDTCDLRTGSVLQVMARGPAEILPLDSERARRKLAKYLGPDESIWDEERFIQGTFENAKSRLVRFSPTHLRARDLSYEVNPPTIDRLDISTAQTIEFIQRIVGDRSATVLDVGCGQGAVVKALAERNFSVMGIDIDPDVVSKAAADGLPVVESDLMSFKGDRFDVVFFGRSLHHIQPLPDAVKHARELMVDDGLLVAEEFALEVMDEPTAAWLYELDSLLQAGGLMRPDHHERNDIQDPLARWRAEHDFDHPLSTGAQMIDEIAKVFELETDDRVAYLYRNLCGRLESSVHRDDLSRRIFDIETSRVEAGELTPLGLRIVARPIP